MVIGKRQGRGRGRRRGHGRGLRHVEDRDRPTLVDSVDDTDVPSSVPPESAEGHQSQERSDDMMLSGVAPTACSRTFVKRSRGKNKNLRFINMIDKHGPLTLEWSEDYQVPVGDNAEAWSRIISLIVYNHCNLHYDGWSKVPDAMVNGLKERVKGCFVLDMELEEQRDALEY